MINIPISRRHNLSLIRKIIEKIFRELRWFLLKTKFYKKILKNKYPVSTPGEIIWVSPNMINKITLNYNNENPLSPLGIVEEGDWDRKSERIKDLKIFKALNEYIANKKSIKKTEFYNSNIETKEEYDKEGGSRIWEYISEYEYENRIKTINHLIDSIKTDGYLTQEQLGCAPIDEIIVKVGRNGEILFFNGIHRLCISKILNIEKIPVIVKTRHREWADLKKELCLYAQMQQIGSKHEGKLYHKLAHLDLQDIPYAHDNEDRFAAIKNNIFTSTGKLLDIGANFGFFCNNFNELGYNCTAVEQDKMLQYFLQKTNNIGGIYFNIVHENILNMFDKPVKFEIVLALNIFHHFLKTKEDYNKLKFLLKNLIMEEMFFEPHDPNESPFSNAYKNLDNEQFLEFIISNSNLTKYEKILDCFENRYLYHLRR